MVGLLSAESYFQAGLPDKGDTVAISAGLPLQTAGTVNMLWVYTIERNGADSSERNDDLMYKKSEETISENTDTTEEVMSSAIRGDG